MYKPPNTDVNEFLKTFQEQLGKIHATKTECIIGLDHNLDLLKQSMHTKAQEFLECILDHNVLPTITKPTRISETSAILIDNILISKKLQPDLESLIILDDLSDHLPCLVNLKNFQQTTVANLKIKCRINESVINKIKENLIDVNWEKALENKSATESFHSFHHILIESLNKHAPEQLVKEKPKKATNPWMSKGLRQSLLKSKKLYEQSLLDPNQQPKYKRYMTILRKRKRKLKLTYYQNKCIEFKKNGMKMWEMINKINGKVHDKTCIIDYLKVDNIKCSSGKDISNQFAKYFSTVGKKFAMKTGPSQTSLKDYLKKMPCSANTMYFTPASVEEVSRLITELNPKNSSGYDNISNKVLKTLCPIILEPFTEIINTSL